MQARHLAVLAMAMATGGCARGAATTGGASPAAASAADIVAQEATEWNGSFRPMQQSQSRVGMTAKSSVFGSVRVIYRESTNRSFATLSLNTSLQISEVLSWAVVPGACGSGGVPIMPASKFPPIEIGSTGRGDVTINNLTIAMPAGSYHVNVYRGGDTLEAVIACANLRKK